MQTHSTNDSTLKPAGHSPPITRSRAVHTMNNAAKESTPTLARQSKTHREFEQGRSTIGEIKQAPAPLPLKQSSVPLNAAPISAMEAEDKHEPKTKKAKEDLEEVEEDLKEVEENLEETKSRINKAYTELSAAQKEIRQETAQSTAQTLLNQMKKTATAKIDPNNQVATAMQKLTKSTLTESDIMKTSWHLQNNPTGTDGDLGFYKRGTEKIVNERGRSVYVSDHLVGKKRYEYWKENDIGLARIQRKKSHNLLKMIPVFAEHFPDFLTCGEDYFQIAEEPTFWDNNKSLAELVAQLFGFPSWRRMQGNVQTRTAELGGMSSVRFIDDDIVPWPSDMPQPCKKAGYIFTFNDDNTTRFDVQGQLSDHPAKNKPTQEEFISKHDFDIYSVEKLDDNGACDETFGIKRCRVYKDVRKEIGRKFWRKNVCGKGVVLKESHMPSVVGEGKRFVASNGTFKVTRLI